MRLFVIVAERVTPIQSGSKNFLSAKTLLIIGQRILAERKFETHSDPPDNNK
jgi:hypothetical protein